MKKLKVLIIPTNNKNSYIEELVSGLKKKGIDAIRKDVKNFFIVFLILKERPDFLHIHWIHPFISSRILVLSIIYAVLFIAQIMIFKLQTQLTTSNNSSFPLFRNPVPIHQGRFSCNKKRTLKKLLQLF